MDRREFMASTSQLAASRWATDGLDPDEIEEWDPMEGTGYETGTFSSEHATATGRLPYTRFENEGCTATIEAMYGPEGAYLILEGVRDDIRVGLLARFSPGEMKQVAAALYQAAEEAERRPSERGD